MNVAVLDVEMNFHHHFIVQFIDKSFSSSSDTLLAILERFLQTINNVGYNQ